MATDSSKPKRSFFVHQLAEYLIGASMVATGLQSPEPLIPSLLGGLIIVNAAIVDAPLGAFRAVGRRTHRVLDFVVLGAIAVGAFLPGVDAATRIIVLALGVVMGFVVFGTNYGTRQLTKGVNDADAAAAAAGSSKGEDIGRFAGRLTARGIQGAKKKLG